MGGQVLTLEGQTRSTSDGIYRFPQVFADSEYTAWKQCKRLLPHTFAFLDREQAADPLVFACLASKTA